MRLSADEISAIKAVTVDVFGPDAVVRLFGSRVDDRRRGGDIDLHIEVRGGRPDYQQEGRFCWHLMRKIGERAIDIVFHDPDAKLRPIDQKARRQGIIL